MKRSDILRTLANDPECKLEWQKLTDNGWRDIQPQCVLIELDRTWYGGEEIDIRLKPKLTRVYFRLQNHHNGNFVIVQQQLTSIGWSNFRADQATHYADLREDGTADGIYLISDLREPQ